MTDPEPVALPPAAFGGADGDAPYGSGDDPEPAPDPGGEPQPEPPAAGAPPANTPHGRAGRFSLGVLQLLGVVLVAALAGAGSALLVARSSGWGTQTVVRQYVAPGGGVSDHPADIKGLLAASLPAVVAVKAGATQANPFLDPGGGSRLTSEGTGVVISAAGEILTNAHVVNGASTLTVTFHDATSHTARIVSVDSDHDLALLQVAGAAELPMLELGDSASVAPGDAVVAIGYALGLAGGPSVTTGIISATGRSTTAESGFGRNSRLANLLQTDASISSGDSGGPLLDAGGRVIGINTMVAMSTSQTAANGIGFAISSDTVKSLLPALRAGG